MAHEKRILPKVDLDALTGIRGILALHIVVFHCFFYSELQIDLLGSCELPMFFLISGFTLTIANGRTQYTSKNCCTSVSPEEKQKLLMEKPEMDWWHFMKKRIARILPMYWLAIAEAIPLSFFGYGYTAPSDLIVGAFVSFGFLSTWAGIGPLVINGPAWFISTIWFFYLVFPILLPRLQAYSTEKKRKWVLWYYFIQLFGAIALFFIFQETFGQFGSSFATMWPISRLPLFLMGILAGLIRYDDPPNVFKPYSTLTCASSSTRSHDVNWLTASLITIFVVWTIVENFVLKEFGILIGGNLWLQLLIPAVQFPLMYGLTYDDARESIVSRALHSRVALQLGRISYAWYLVHEPMIYYLAFAVHGSQSPEVADEPGAQERFDANRRIPAWGIPVVIVVSFFVAFILNRCFEEPLGKLLRPKSPSVAQVGRAEKNKRSGGVGGKP